MPALLSQCMNGSTLAMAFSSTAVLKRATCLDSTGLQAGKPSTGMQKHNARETSKAYLLIFRHRVILVACILAVLTVFMKVAKSKAVSARA